MTIPSRELPDGARQQGTIRHITSEPRAQRPSGPVDRADLRPLPRIRALTERSEQEWYRRGYIAPLSLIIGTKVLFCVQGSP